MGLGSSGSRLNPFELGREPDALTRRGLFIHTLVALLLRTEPSPAAGAALDRATRMWVRLPSSKSKYQFFSLRRTPLMVFI